MNPSNDVAADGYTVYASTLTKDGAAANATLHETYKDDPNKLAEETKKMLEDHPEYIAKTVYGKTDAEGRWNVVSMIFTVLIIAFVVGLSVWIMWSMHYHMMIN